MIQARNIELCYQGNDKIGSEYVLSYLCDDHRQLVEILGTMRTSLRNQDTYSQTLASALAVMQAHAKRFMAAAEDSLAAATLETRKIVETLRNDVRCLRD